MSSVIKSSRVVNVVTGHTECINQTIDDIVEEKIKEANKLYEEIITKAKTQADSILSEAKKKSDEILEETYRETKNIIEQAKETGYKQGYQQGFEDGKKDSDELILEANEIKRNFLHEREVILSSIEGDVIHLIISLCEKILNQKLDDDKEAIIPIILKGINSLNIKDSIMIRVSKEDYDIVELSKQRILTTANLIDDIDVRIDSSLSRGGCIIEASNGNVDASIEVQVSEMKKTIINLLNGE